MNSWNSPPTYHGMGVSGDITTGPPDPEPEMYQLCGHRIVINVDSVECEMCGESREIPYIIRESSGHREAIYKMFLLGQLKQERCMPQPDEHPIGDRFVTDDGTEWMHIGDNVWQNDDGYTITGYPQSNGSYKPPDSYTIGQLDASSIEYTSRDSTVDTSDEADSSESSWRDRLPWN